MSSYAGQIGLLTTTSVAIDGSKFKAVNNRDKNFTRGKVERRRAQLEESVARYLSQLDTADRQEPTVVGLSASRSATSVDAAVSEEVLRAISPLGLEAAMQAIADREDIINE